MKCMICGCKVTLKNSGLFPIDELLSYEEHQRFENVEGKELCLDCKRELLFANIIAVTFKKR